MKELINVVETMSESEKEQRRSLMRKHHADIDWGRTQHSHDRQLIAHRIGMHVRRLRVVRRGDGVDLVF